MNSFEKKLEKFVADFGKLGTAEKTIAVSILLGCFFIGFIAPVIYPALYSPGLNPSKLIPTPTPIPIPAGITLTAPKNTFKTGDNIPVTINLNSPNQGIPVAEIVADFDPQILRIVTVSPGSYFHRYPIQSTGTNFVKISGIADLVDNKFIITKGAGTFASVIFKAVAPSAGTQIYIDPAKTTVANGQMNILGKISNLTVSVQ